MITVSTRRPMRGMLNSRKIEPLSFQQVDLGQPSVPLSRKNCEVAVCCQPAEDDIGVQLKKLGDCAPIPESRQVWRAAWMCHHFHLRYDAVPGAQPRVLKNNRKKLKVDPIARKFQDAWSITSPRA